MDGKTESLLTKQLESWEYLLKVQIENAHKEQEYWDKKLELKETALINAGKKFYQYLVI